jgi:hypothetical protein
MDRDRATPVCECIGGPLDGARVRIHGPDALFPWHNGRYIHTLGYRYRWHAGEPRTEYTRGRGQHVEVLGSEYRMDPELRRLPDLKRRRDAA